MNFHGSAWNARMSAWVFVFLSMELLLIPRGVAKSLKVKVVIKFYLS